MKLVKNKTHYTIKKGMGDVIIGEIINYVGMGPRLNLNKDSCLGYEIDDLKFILNKMLELQNDTTV